MEHEERISPASDPRLIAEHETRYRFARGAIEHAATRCDLGCGTAAGSSRALTDALPEAVVLVDLSEDAIDSACRNLGRAGAHRNQADLTIDSDLQRLRNLLDSLPKPLVVTCFEVIEHLPTIQPIIAFFSALADDGATVVISAPNDVFHGVTNPYHLTAWGASTFREFVQFLPTDRRISEQYSVEGTTIVEKSSTSPMSVPATTPAMLGASPAPFAFLVSFGPLAEQMSPVTATSVTDSVNQRMWEAQRAVDLEYYRRRLVELETELDAIRNSAP